MDEEETCSVWVNMLIGVWCVHFIHSAEQKGQRLTLTHMHIQTLLFLSTKDYNHLSSSALHKVATDNSSPITWKDSTRLRKQLVFVVHPSLRMPRGSFPVASSWTDTITSQASGKNPSFHCAFNISASRYFLHLFLSLLLPTMTTMETRGWKWFMSISEKRARNANNNSIHSFLVSHFSNIN